MVTMPDKQVKVSPTHHEKLLRLLERKPNKTTIKQLVESWIDREYQKQEGKR